MSGNELQRMQRSAVRNRVFWGGSAASYVGSSGVSGGTGSGRTFVSRDATRGIRQDGYVRQVKFNIIQNGGSSYNRFRIKQMRPNGSSFDVVSESALISVGSGTGDRTYNLPTPLGPFAMGDRIGVFMTGGSGATTWSIAANTGTSSSISSYEGDASGGESYTDYSGVDLLVQALGSSPIFVTDGDSIPEGHNGGTGNMWHGPMHTGPAGNRNADIFYKALQLLPGVDYQGLAVGSSTWAMTLARVSNVVAAKPAAVMLSCGVNDIVLGRSWNDVLNDMYAYLLALPPTTEVFLCEMLPYPGTDAQAATIREWNANYADFCGMNYLTLIRSHDAMGVVRPSTGLIDDLNPAFNVGDGHLTLAGVEAYGQIIAAAIAPVLYG